MSENAFLSSRWIWHGGEICENSYAEFCEKINFNGENTVLRISVRGDYTLFINGKFVECNQFPDFEHFKIYDEIDITPYLEKGENRICFLVWYFGKSGMRYNTPDPGLIYEILQNGRVVAFSSGNTLSRASKAYENGFERKISNQLGYSFSYDAVREDDWLTSDRDGFESSVVLGGTREITARKTEKLRLGGLIRGVMSKTESSYLFDLGEEFVGLPTFSLVSEKEQMINIAYGEVLDGGHVKRIIHNRDFSFDYNCKEGKNEYTNYMLRFACRYIEITSEAPVDIEYAGVIPQYYPAEAKKVSLENPLDEKIYEICLNTLRLSMMEHYVDCPWREQCLYAFDARNQMLSGYSAFVGGNREYVRANLQLISKDNREDNLLSICFPSAENLTIPSFSLYYIIAVNEYMLNTGDLSLGEEVIEKIESILSVFVGNMKDGLIVRMSDECHWNFYDWSKYCSSSNDAPRGEADAIINSIAVMALEAYLDICRLISRRSRYEKSLIDSIRKCAREKFYNPEKGIFFMYDINEDPTELVNALAVLSGVAVGETAKGICEKLASGSLESCSLSMKVFKYDALLKISLDYKDTVLDEIRNTYKIMLDFGSTTVWEEIKGAKAFDNAGSLCHGWSAVPIHFYHKLGLVK